MDAKVVTEGPFVVHPDRAWVCPAADLDRPLCAMRHPADDVPEAVAFSTAWLIAHSLNSYQRHCPDPVSAAEGDLLGRCVEALRALRPANLGRVPDSMRDDETLPVDMTIREIRMIDAILSQVREVRS